MKSNNVLPLVCLIVGSIIGAGFISGREIVTFFGGQDALISSAACFICFTVVISFLLNVKNLENNAVFGIFQPMILFFDLVIASGMLASFDSVAQSVFGINKDIPTLSLVAVVLSNIILYKGVKGVEKANAILVPLMIAAVMVLVVAGGDFDIVPTGAIKPLDIISYVGLNTFTAALLFADAGKNLKAGENALAAIISSLVLSGLILLISVATCGAGKKVISSDVPLLTLAAGGSVIYYLYLISFSSGIFTTLLSSHYPLFCFVENKRFTFFNRFILSVAALGISRLGFYNIVDKIYPVIGLFGALGVVAISISTIFFPPKKRKSTSNPQGRTV